MRLLIDRIFCGFPQTRPGRKRYRPPASRHSPFQAQRPVVPASYARRSADAREALHRTESRFAEAQVQVLEYRIDGKHAHQRHSRQQQQPGGHRSSCLFRKLFVHQAITSFKRYWFVISGGKKGPGKGSCALSPEPRPIDQRYSERIWSALFCSSVIASSTVISCLMAACR